MYLTEEHIKNVHVIFESENECITIKEFVDEHGYYLPDPRALIDELLELDLIETENDGRLFFLTPLGYEVAEGEWERQPEKSNQKATLKAEDILELTRQIGPKKTKKYVLIGLFLFAVVVALYAHFYSDELNNKNSELDTILTEEIIDQIKTASDSLSKLKD